MVVDKKTLEESLSPPAQADTPSAEPKIENKRRGGRKRAWDWDGAQTEATVYIHENGMPEPAVLLVKHLEGWLFKQRGDPNAVPDRREIYRRIVTPITERFGRGAD